MFILDVIPIARGILREKLSYFSAKNIPLGSLVEIPLRKKIVKALVIERKSISDAKSEVRRADFLMKKITSSKISNFLPMSFIEAASETAIFFASTTGAVLNNSFPKTILESVDEGFKISPEKDFTKNHHEKLVIQANDEERFSTYKSLIREEFAKNSSVLFIVPNIEDVERVKEVLEKGIEKYTFCLSGDIKKKEIVGVWSKALNENHPVLVIATPGFMYLPRADISIMILERESSNAYRKLSKPFIDMRVLAEILSKKRGIKLLFGDELLRVETIYREKNLEFADLTSLKFRSVSSTAQSLAIFKKKTEQEEFSPLTQELIDLLQNAQKHKERTFIYGTRPGLHSLIQCSDCGESVGCHNCSNPLVLHAEGKKRFLLCHKCNFQSNVEVQCKNCSGWRLQALGIGIELIEEKIKELFPKSQIFRIDRTKEKNQKQVREKISQFLQTPGGILIGTEASLNLLSKKVENFVCGAIDSLFSIPDFRINEKVLSLLLRLRSKASTRFLIQTRHEDLKIWQYLFDGNLIDFYREEIEFRKTLNYPPFSFLIKITIQGKQEAVERESEKVVDLFKEWEAQSYPSFISKIKGQYIMNILLKIKPTDWPNQEITNRLNSLSPKFIIKIDPENIL